VLILPCRSIVLMKSTCLYLALTGAFIVCGCSSTSTFVKNAANSNCERRVQTDRERCERNVQSSDDALMMRKNAKREAQWARVP
jgi:hypothetical protein